MRIHIHKGYQVKPSKENPHSWIVVTDGKGGKIPKVLEGMFTSPTLAIRNIDNYVDSKTSTVK